MIFSLRSDLQIARDSGSRFLPWLVAVMVFMAALGLSAALTLQGLIDGWRADAAGTLTVQVMPVIGDADEARVATRERVAAVEAALEKFPGIEKVEALSEEELSNLLTPWLGDDPVIRDLPVPKLIDVRLDDGVKIDLEALEKRLKEVTPEISIDAHQLWIARLTGLAEGLRILALTVMIMVILATTVTVVHATHASLAVHRQQISVLHMVGAHDIYIARQYAGRWLWLGLSGGVLGLLLAAPALFGLGWLAGKIEGALIPELSLNIMNLAPLLFLPLGSAILSMLTARITVMRVLSRMP